MSRLLLLSFTYISPSTAAFRAFTAAAAAHDPLGAVYARARPHFDDHDRLVSKLSFHFIVESIHKEEHDACPQSLEFLWINGLD